MTYDPAATVPAIPGDPSGGGGGGLSAGQVTALVEGLDIDAATLEGSDLAAVIAAVSGGTVASIDDTDSPYTVGANEYVVVVDATSVDVVVVLAAAATRTNDQVTIKRIDGSVNAVTVDGDAAETIDAAATIAITTQYESVTVVSDGTEWWIL